LPRLVVTTHHYFMCIGTWQENTSWKQMVTCGYMWIHRLDNMKILLLLLLLLLLSHLIISPLLLSQYCCPTIIFP
jgi:hypothetical protein